MNAHRPVPPRVSSLIREICSQYGVTVNDVMGRDQDEVVVSVRHEIWRTLREEVVFADGRPPSWPRIGGWFARDHTTIMSGVKRAGLRGKPVFDAVEIRGVRL